jgi:hypothetical protein
MHQCIRISSLVSNKISKFHGIFLLVMDDKDKLLLVAQDRPSKFNNPTDPMVLYSDSLAQSFQ